MDDTGLDQFRAACGVRGPLCVTRPDGGSVVAVREPGLPFAVVGRDSTADLTLEDPAVSRRHAYMQVIDGRAFWIDIGGRGGVTWRAGRAKAGWADGRDGVEVGPFRVVAQASPDDPPPRRWSPIATATPQATTWPPLRIDLIDDLPGARPGRVRSGGFSPWSAGPRPATSAWSTGPSRHTTRPWSAPPRGRGSSTCSAAAAPASMASPSGSPGSATATSCNSGRIGSAPCVTPGPAPAWPSSGPPRPRPRRRVARPGRRPVGRGAHRRPRVDPGRAARPVPRGADLAAEVAGRRQSRRDRRPAVRGRRVATAGAGGPARRDGPAGPRGPTRPGPAGGRPGPGAGLADAPLRGGPRGPARRLRRVFGTVIGQRRRGPAGDVS